MKLDLCEISALYFIHLHCFYRCYIFSFSSFISAEVYFTSTYYLKAFPTAAYFNVCNHHMCLFFPASLLFLFVELPLRAKAGKAMEDVSVAGGHLANYMQCFQQLLYCLQVCPGFGQLMILLNFHCPFIYRFLSQLVLYLDQCMLKAEYIFQKSVTNQTCNILHRNH